MHKKQNQKKKKRIAHFYFRNSEKLNHSQVLDSLRSVEQFFVYVCHKSIKGESLGESDRKAQVIYVEILFDTALENLSRVSKALCSKSRTIIQSYAKHDHEKNPRFRFISP